MTQYCRFRINQLFSHFGLLFTYSELLDADFQQLGCKASHRQTTIFCCRLQRSLYVLPTAPGTALCLTGRASDVTSAAICVRTVLVERMRSSVPTPPVKSTEGSASAVTATSLWNCTIASAGRKDNMNVERSGLTWPV